MTNSMLEILKRKLLVANKHLEASINGLKFFKDHPKLIVNPRTRNIYLEAMLGDQEVIRDLIKQIIGDV